MRLGFARKPGIVFVARFFAALIVFYLVIASDPVNDHVIVPFTHFLVRITAGTLQWLREPIDVAGSVIRTSPRFALDVRNGCNAVDAMMLIAAAMLAFPATFRSRLKGLLVTSAAIQIVNLVRIFSLVWLGEHYHEAFEFVHVAVWQTVVILFAVTMFVLWSLRFAEKPLHAGH